jgi:flagellar hook-associated protein 1 FlgK
MANLFGSLYIGASGLRNAQYAMNTTANNLANVDTTGYVRQQVRFADQTYVTLKQAFQNVNLQQSGLGVTIGDVVHARNIFLDKAYRLESGRQAYYDTQYETVDYVEDLMQELNGEEFKESLSDLCSAFQQLSTTPEMSEYQNLVLEKSELFVSRSVGLYKDLQDYQSNINDQIKEKVDRVNEIGQEIYDLNIQIQKIEAGGIETAMTLRDERDNLLDELATYGSITVNEDASGFTYVNFEYVEFVDDIKAYTIGLAKDTTDGTGFYTPYWEHLTSDTSNPYEVFDLTEKISSDLKTDVGGIKSLLLARGSVYGRYENMAEKTEDGILNYSDIADSTLMEVEAELDNLFHTIVTEINDIFAPKTDVVTALGNGGFTLTKNDADGTYTYLDANNNNQSTIFIDAKGNFEAQIGTDENGDPVYKTFNINDWQALDVTSENYALGKNGEIPQEMFSRGGSDNYYEVEINNNTYYLYRNEDPNIDSTRYGIGNVEVNQAYETVLSSMPSYTENGATAMTFGAALRAAWEATGMNLNPTDLTPCSYEGYYNKMVDNLGVKGNTYMTISETMAASVDSYDNQRKQVTGVSSDEELVNMIKYQAAYNAASRYITVISEMTEVIVGLI